MALDRDSRNLYPIPHGPEMARANVHEQNTLVESRFTVALPVYSILYILELEMYRSVPHASPYAGPRRPPGPALWGPAVMLDRARRGLHLRIS